MTETQWLYDLLKVIDDVANMVQVLDDVPNIQEWVNSIRQEERERCFNICAERAEHWAGLAKEAQEKAKWLLDARTMEASKCADAIQEAT